MLEGAVPGVQLTTATNQPGTDAAIYVRGVGSLNAGTGALIVLDGSPYQGSLSDINPADIESISVSKDATANSLYGSRAANGVVFITTKRGSLDNPRSASTRDSVSTPALSPSMTSSPIRANTSRRSGARCATRSGASSPEEGGGDLAAAALYASQEVLGAHGNYNPYKYSSTYLIDPATGKLDPSARRMYSERLQDELFKTGFRNETNVSVSGGNEKSDYFISLGYLKDESYVIESDFERYSARVNVNTKLRKWIKVGANLSYAHTVQNNILEGSSLASSAFATARSWEPVFPVYARDAEGKIKYDENGDKVYDLGTGADRRHDDPSRNLGPEHHRHAEDGHARHQTQQLAGPRLRGRSISCATSPSPRACRWAIAPPTNCCSITPRSAPDAVPRAGSTKSLRTFTI